MIDPREYFLQEAIAHARTLPLKDAVVFLRGLLECGQESKAMGAVRSLFLLLSESDRQLELIELGQLKLKFPSTGNPQHDGPSAHGSDATRDGI